MMRMNEYIGESVARRLYMMFSEHFWPIFAIRIKTRVTDGPTDGQTIIEMRGRIYK